MEQMERLKSEGRQERWQLSWPKGEAQEAGPRSRESGTGNEDPSPGPRVDQESLHLCV